MEVLWEVGSLSKVGACMPVCGGGAACVWWGNMGINR